MVGQRQVAADAIALARIVLGTFTEQGSIGAIANVRRSTWIDAGRVLAWRENLDRLAGELTPRVEFCNWCPTPAAPEPAFHPNGVAAHQETIRPAFGYQCTDPTCPLAGLQHGHGAGFVT